MLHIYSLENKILINYSGNSLFFSNMFIILLLLFFRALYSRVKNQRIKVISLYHNFQEFIQLFYEGPSIFDFLNQNIYNFASNYLNQIICRLFFGNKLYTHFLNFILQLCLTLLVHQLRQLHYSFEAAVKWGWGIFFFGGGGYYNKTFS